jgi:hypothetical protein
MRKPMRILVRILVLLLIALIVLVAGGWYLSRLAPSGYVVTPPDAPWVAEKANQATQKMLDLGTWAARRQAAEAAARSNNPIPQADPTKTLAFTQDELNAALIHWSQFRDVKAQYESFVTDPMLLIRDDRLALAGRVEEVGRVVQIEFRPYLADGLLHLPIERVSGGRLPLPRAAIDGPLKRLAETVRAELLRVSSNARLDSYGTANEEAMSATYFRLLLCAIESRPAEPVLMLRMGAEDERYLPVRLTRVGAAEQNIEFEFEPLPRDERKAFIQRLREGVEPKPEAARSAD